MIINTVGFVIEVIYLQLYPSSIHKQRIDRESDELRKRCIRIDPLLNIDTKQIKNMLELAEESSLQSTIKEEWHGRGGSSLIKATGGQTLRFLTREVQQLKLLPRADTQYLISDTLYSSPNKGQTSTWLEIHFM